MAKSNADIQKDKYEKQKAELERLKAKKVEFIMPQSVFGMLKDLCKWHSFSDWREALTTLIINAHRAGPGESARMFTVPRHDFVITEKVSRQIEEENRRQQRLDPGDLPNHMLD